MLRLMTYKDIPVIAQYWYNEKQQTCFAQFDVEWSVGQCAGFLTEQLGQSNQLLLVAEIDGVIVGACGATLGYEWMIPHPLVVNEWMWWGIDKRVSVQLFRAMRQWGQKNHAQFIRYVLNVPGQSPTKCVEAVRWEAL